MLMTESACLPLGGAVSAVCTWRQDACISLGGCWTHRHPCPSWWSLTKPLLGWVMAADAKDILSWPAYPMHHQAICQSRRSSPTPFPSPVSTHLKNFFYLVCCQHGGMEKSLLKSEQSFKLCKIAILNVIIVINFSSCSFLFFFFLVLGNSVPASTCRSLSNCIHWQEHLLWS